MGYGPLFNGTDAKNERDVTGEFGWGCFDSLTNCNNKDSSIDSDLIQAAHCSSTRVVGTDSYSSDHAC